MKKEYRGYKAQVRQSQYATGGGPAAEIDTYPFLDDMDELISLSAEGLYNADDSDRAVGEKSKDQKSKSQKSSEPQNWDVESKDSSMDMEVEEVFI